MGDGAHEDEDAVEGERDEEEIEVSVVPLAHTVAHPIAPAVVSAPVVAHSVVATDPMAAPAKEAESEDGEKDEGSEDSA